MIRARWKNSAATAIPQRMMKNDANVHAYPPSIPSIKFIAIKQIMVKKTATIIDAYTRFHS
jgi:hypothetical protein